MELLNWKAEEIPELSHHLNSKIHYTSPTSQNEIIKLIGSSIQATLVSKVQKNGVWSLIADETSDIAHNEQPSLCFRTVSKDLAVEEHFFKYITVPSTDALSLVTAIRGNTFDAGFPTDTLYFQCYDGAANMKGQYSGVATRIRQLSPNAVYIHCHSHLLNLSLQNCCNTIKPIRNCLGQVNAIYNFLQASPKRHAVVAEKQKTILGDEKKHKTLKLLCETRWASRSNAINAVVANYEVILDALEEISVKWQQKPTHF